MLQALREKTGSLLAKIILGLIVIAFSFFGIESYFQARSDTFVARIGDREISSDQFRSRFEEYRQVQMQRSGGALEPRYFEQPQVKRQVLDQLIDEQVMLAANKDLGVVIPVDRVRQEILRIPNFQSNGQFDPALYRAALGAQGMTPAMFDVRVSEDMASREMAMQIATSAVVTDAEVDAYLRLRGQQRDVRFIALPAPTLTDSEVAAEAIEAYYTEHQQDFMFPEQIAIEYVELEGSKLDVNVTPDEATLRGRYDNEKARFVSTEQRLASHVLVKVGGKGAPDDQKAALEKAQKFADDARSGKEFAALAREHSEDLGSRSLGGDLGWIDREMTDPAFESALYALEKGAISDPVLSAEGYHVIELRDVRPGATRTFEEVRDELAREFTESERERGFSTTSGRLIDLTYQDSTSLEPAARDAGLQVQTTPLFSRDGGEGIAANPLILRAAFSDQVLVQGNNSDSVEIGPEHIIVLRIAEHRQASPKPLDDVREPIRERILEARLASQARERADALFARIGAGESLEAIAGEAGFQVNEEKGIGRNAINLDSALVSAIFEMPRLRDDVPETRLVALAGNEFAIVHLEGVADADPTALDTPSREAARNVLQQAGAMEETRDFMAAIRAGMKITIAEDRL